MIYKFIVLTNRVTMFQRYKVDGPCGRFFNGCQCSQTERSSVNKRCRHLLTLLLIALKAYFVTL